MSLQELRECIEDTIPKDIDYRGYYDRYWQGWKAGVQVILSKIDEMMLYSDNKIIERMCTNED
jgi:hypothetical protein